MALYSQGVGFGIRSTYVMAYVFGRIEVIPYVWLQGRDRIRAGMDRIELGVSLGRARPSTGGQGRRNSNGAGGTGKNFAVLNYVFRLSTVLDEAGVVVLGFERNFHRCSLNWISRTLLN